MPVVCRVLDIKSSVIPVKPLTDHGRSTFEAHDAVARQIDVFGIRVLKRMLNREGKQEQAVAIKMKEKVIGRSRRVSIVVSRLAVTR